MLHVPCRYDQDKKPVNSWFDLSCVLVYLWHFVQYLLVGGVYLCGFYFQSYDGF